MSEISTFQSIELIGNSVERCRSTLLSSRKDLVADLNELDNQSLTDDQRQQWINTINIEHITRYATNSQAPLVVCGENSSGKTSFIQVLLQIGSILPTQSGPVTARIVRFSYASASRARLRVYDCLEERRCLLELSLSQFFGENETNWEGIKNSIKEHLLRPDPGTQGRHDFDRSQIFVEWAQKFIEIQLPSPLLEQGIDIYDTPGFLFHDAPVLKENVKKLATFVRPMLIFMYPNPVMNDETINGFLALQSALGSLQFRNIFFLNSCVDIDRFEEISDDTSEQEFEIMLVKERQHRYELLMKCPTIVYELLGGFPATVEQCSSFSVCAATWNDDPLGKLMNDACRKQILDYMRKSRWSLLDRTITILMHAVDVYINFFHVLRHHTKEQLDLQHRRAMEWLQNFKNTHRLVFQRFIRNVFGKIDHCFKSDRQALINRVLNIKPNDSKQIEDYLRAVIQQEIIKRSVNEAYKLMYSSEISTPLRRIDDCLGQSIAMLCEAINQEEHVHSDTSLSLVQHFAVKVFQSPLLVMFRVLSDDVNEDNIDHDFCDSVKSLVQDMAKRVYPNEQSESEVTETFNPSSEASKCFEKIQLETVTKCDSLDEIIQAQVEHQMENVQFYLELQYQTANSLLEAREQAFSCLNKHYSTYVQIECQLVAAQHLTRFHGVKPSIGEARSNGFLFSIHSAQWDTKGNLLAKKLNLRSKSRNNTMLSYLEGHYHRSLLRSPIPDIVTMLYMYEDSDLNELWFVFPEHACDLSQLLACNENIIDLKFVLKILIRTATTLCAYHHNDLVHGNICLSNIVFNDQNSSDSLLADFGFHDYQSTDMVNDGHQVTAERIVKDISDLAQIGLRLLHIVAKDPINNAVEQILRHYVKFNYDERNGSAHSFLSSLEAVAQLLNK